MTNSRHIITYEYSLQQQVGVNGIENVDITKWTDMTPAGLAKFVQKELPNWQRLIITKNTIITDPRKSKTGGVVATKKSVLQIGLAGTGSLCFEVERDMTRNGQIPMHLRRFFGEKQK